MKKMFFPFFYSFICLFVYLFVPTATVSAAGEFRADYDVNYSISPVGVAIVTQNIVLTNKQTNLYPQKYAITIDSEKIRNVLAYDNGGIVNPVITQRDKKTEIILQFNEKSVGLGKQLRFTLRYEDADIAHKNGNIWEINIPRVATDPDMETYGVTLSVPPTFGPNAYMTPLPANGNRFTMDQMIQGGISAAYGDVQVFNTQLTYHIENVSLAPKLTEIALPPDTAFQKIYIKSLDPKPKTVLADSDGNWLAQYDLLPTQRMEIHANIVILVYLESIQEYVHTPPDREMYTKPLKYWESNNPKIIDLAKTYKTPRDIYMYVTRALSYDDKRVKSSPVRKGAAQALETPANSICMEFTDLFIAMARAAGIPAREVIGYAYTTNLTLRPLSLVLDVLHVWPEYYDTERNIWIPVDPTWGNTTGGVNYFDKLDFNHIVFAIHGQSSEYPYPAGFYKKPGEQTKDVEVTFQGTIPDVPPGKVSATYIFPKTVTSGFNANGSVILESIQGTSLEKATVGIRSSPFDVAITREYLNIPPFAKISIPISIPMPGYFLKGKGDIVTSINNELSNYSFEIQPLMQRFTVPISIFIVIVLIITFIFLRTLVWKNRKK